MLIHALLFAAASAAPAARSIGADARPPNVVVVLVDDLAYGDLGVHGNTVFSTPALDRIAAESVRLDDFHAAPRCAPTRAELLTGRWYPRTGVWGVHAGRDHMRLDETTLAQRFRTAGYATALLGKWHLGDSHPYLPEDRGFDEVWHITQRLYMHFDPRVEHRHGGETETLAPEAWTSAWLVDTTLAFARRSHAGERPFFAWLALPEIHAPWHGPHNAVKRYRRKGLSPDLAAIAAMIEQLDREVDRLVAGLDELEGDTIVVFVSDNGPDDESRQTQARLSAADMAARNPAGLRGSKGDVYEGGTRVPCLVRWPEHLAPGVVDEPTSSVDLAPTLLALAGVEASGGQPFDGQNLAGSVAGAVRDGARDGAPLPERALFSIDGVRRRPGQEPYDVLDKRHLRFDDQELAVRRGRWKLVQRDGRRELFDLDSDPGEVDDRAAERLETVAQLKLELERWWTELVASERTFHAPTFHVGLPGTATVSIPADAPIATRGHVQPEKHATALWKESGDAQEIALEVHAAGRYAVALDLVIARPTGRIVVRAGESSCGARLAEARGTRLELGPIDLAAGATRLVIELDGVPVDDGIVVSRITAVELTRL